VISGSGNDKHRKQASFFGDFLLPAATITQVRTIDSIFSFLPNRGIQTVACRSVSGFREMDTNCPGDPFTRNSPLLLLLLREGEREREKEN